jgi:hypothetical protein
LRSRQEADNCGATHNLFEKARFVADHSDTPHLFSDYVAGVYCFLAEQFSVEQKRTLSDFGVWPVLIALLNSRSDIVVRAAANLMVHLSTNRDGEDYNRFIEEGLFEELAKNLPSSITFVRSALVTVADRFPLPSCCAPLVKALSEQTRADPLSAMNAFTLLTKLADCRGLTSSAFAPRSCYVLLPL